MGKLKPGLTLIKHESLGEELKKIHGRLLEISIEIGWAYPLKELKGLHKKPFKAVLELRSRLDDLVFKENPGGTANDIGRIYFPGSRSD